MVTRLDRLARSTRDLLNTLAAITGKGAGFRSLNDTWADTTTAHGRLMLTVLGGLAEFERELIRARTGEGRARAVARGVKAGGRARIKSSGRESPHTSKLGLWQSKTTKAVQPPFHTDQVGSDGATLVRSILGTVVRCTIRFGFFPGGFILRP